MTDRETRYERAKKMAGYIGEDEQMFDDLCGKIYRQCLYCKNNKFEEHGLICRTDPCAFVDAGGNVFDIEYERQRMEQMKEQRND